MDRRLFLVTLMLAGPTAVSALAQTPPAAPPTR